MKDTNAIEKALKNKCEQELKQVVSVFMNELEVKIRGEYNYLWSSWSWQRYSI